MYQQRQKWETVLQIITQLQREKTASRSSLAEGLELYSSTISIRMKELVGRGLIRECGTGEGGQRGGRRATMVELNPAYGCFGGIYLRRRELTASLFTLALDETAQKSIPLLSGKKEEVLQACRDAAGWLNSEGGGSLLGLGCAASSVVLGGGTVGSSSHFPWTLEELPRILAAGTGGAIIHTDNDANLAALADLDLLERNERNLIHFLVYDRIPTIGSGIVLDGKVYRGSCGGAGELDETLWSLDKPLAGSILRLAGLMGRYLDVNAIFISGEMEPELSGEISSLIETSDCGFSRRLITDKRWVEKGAALMAMHKHIQTITGGDV